MTTDDHTTAAPHLTSTTGTAGTTFGSHPVSIRLGGVSQHHPTVSGEHAIINGNGLSYVFDQLSGTSGRMSAVISSKKSPSPSWDFGPGMSLEVTPEGGATLSKEGQPIALFDAPWAVDATGKTLPSRYEAHNGLLTQVIDYPRGTTFPVVADPTWKVYPWYVRVTFNRYESIRVTATVAACVPIMGLIPSLPTKVVAAACLLLVATHLSPISEPNACLTVKVYTLISRIDPYVHHC